MHVPCRIHMRFVCIGGREENLIDKQSFCTLAPSSQLPQKKRFVLLNMQYWFVPISFIKLTWNMLNWLQIFCFFFCCFDLNFLFIGRPSAKPLLFASQTALRPFAVHGYTFVQNFQISNATQMVLESRILCQLSSFMQRPNYEIQMPLCYSIKTSKLFLGLCEFKSIFWTRAKWQSICVAHS